MTTMDIKLAIQKCKAQKTVTLAMAVMLTFAPGAAALAGTFKVVGESQSVSPGAGTYVYATHATEPYVKSSAHTAATQTTTATSSKSATSAPATSVKPWKIAGLPAAVDTSIRGIPMIGNPDTLASLVIAMTRQSGLVGESAVVDVGSHTIFFKTNKTVVSGALSPYLNDKQAQTLSGISKNNRLMVAAAAAQGGTAAIHIGTPGKTGTIPVSAGVNNPGIRYFGGVLLSSFGPRYAGSDIVSEYGSVRGRGYNGNIAFTQGLPSWTPQQSFGGYYYGVSGAINHPTPYGIFGVSGQFAYYQEGGQSRNLGIKGTQGLFGLTYAYPFSKNWTVVEDLYYGLQTESFNSANMHASQDFVAERTGLDGIIHTHYKHGFISLKAHLWDGFGGHTTGLLLGNQSSNAWEKGTINADLMQPLPFDTAVQVEAGGQYGTGGLPEQEYFILGGPWHGDSYYTGQAATSSGMYAGVRFYAPDIHYKFHSHTYAARPFFGFDGAEGTAAYGQRLEAASVDMGSKFQFSRHLSGDAGYAWSIDNQGPHKPGGRLFFDVTGNY